MNKLYISIFALFTVAILFSGTSASPVYAVEDSSGGFTSLIQRIVERFGLNQAQVETVFDEVRSEREQQRQQMHNKHMQELISNGTITQEQADQLEEKHTQMMQSEKDWMNLTREERQTKRESHRLEMKNWVNEQGIDLSLIRPKEADLGNRGMRMGW